VVYGIVAMLILAFEAGEGIRQKGCFHTRPSQLLLDCGFIDCLLLHILIWTFFEGVHRDRAINSNVNSLNIFRLWEVHSMLNLKITFQPT